MRNSRSDIASLRLWIDRFMQRLLHPVFIALILSLIIILVMPGDLFTRYIITPEKSDLLRNNEKWIHVADLNNDGLSEWIILKENVRGQAALKLHRHNFEIIDQYDFDGRFHADPSNSFATGDWDGNGYSEIFLVTHKFDSVFLNSVEPFNPSGINKKCHFLTRIHIVDDTVDFTIENVNVVDLDRDDYKKVLCNINGGFSMLPRSLFAVDMKRNTVTASPFSGVKLGTPVLFDIAGDSCLEIIMCNTSVKNIHDSLDLGYSDYNAMFLAFNHRLEWLFEPVILKGVYTSVNAAIIKNKGEAKIVLMHSTRKPGREPHTLYLFNSSGNKIRERELNPEGLNIYHLRPDRNARLHEHAILFGVNSGTFFRVDPDLTLHTVFDFGRSIRVFDQLDCDRDGIHEWVLSGNDLSTFTIYRQDFKHPVSYSMPTDPRGRSHFQVVKSGQENHLLVINKEQWFVLKYEKNPLFFLKYLHWLLIYIIILLIVIGIQKAQSMRIQKKIRTERIIAELQLRNARSQLDPHFTFNALNTIGSLINKNDREKVNSYFSRFAGLVRSVLDMSDRISRPLSEEIAFTTNYLELEKIRFGNRFDYKIKVVDQIDLSVAVPKMIIQTYAENAVKHGLRPLAKGGMLEIRIGLAGENLTILIRDNGVGRKSAHASGTAGTGKGMEVMRQIYELYEQLYRIRISQQVNDLTDREGNAAGTEIAITINLRQI